VNSKLIHLQVHTMSTDSLSVHGFYTFMKHLRLSRGGEEEIVWWIHIHWYNLCRFIALQIRVLHIHEISQAVEGWRRGDSLVDSYTLIRSVQIHCSTDSTNSLGVSGCQVWRRGAVICVATPRAERSPAKIQSGSELRRTTGANVRYPSNET